MIRLGKRRPLILLLLVFAAVSISPAPKAIGAAVGFYASTFDPPTRSQIRMIHCALGDDGLHKECGELGKSISRLVVLVIEDSEKDTFASSREQILMLKRALQKDSGGRVSVDIEGFYLARFARAHSDLRIAALFVISDETLGDITIEETNAVRKRIDQSVDKLLAVLFSKVRQTTQ